MSDQAKGEGGSGRYVVLTRDVVRSRRKRAVRGASLAARRITRRDLELGRLMYPEDTSSERPKTRGECEGGVRPCPFVSCKYNLYLDVSDIGSIKLNFPDLEPHELLESCALDVADRDGATLEEVGDVMNLTRERVRQVERIALATVRGDREYMARAADGAEVPTAPESGVRRRLPVLPPESTWLDEDQDGPDANPALHFAVGASRERW